MTEAADRGLAAWIEGSAFAGPDGAPEALFHATDAAFNVFTRWDDFSIGFHLGTELAANARAEVLVDAAEVAETDATDPERDAVPGRNGPAVMKVFCRARNPLRVRDLYTWEQDAVADALLEAGIVDEDEAEMIVDSASCEMVFAALEEAGHDALVYSNLCEHKEEATDSVMFWRAELVKSAFSETFDPADPRIVPQAPDDGSARSDLRHWEATAEGIEEAREELRAFRAARSAAPA